MTWSRCATQPISSPDDDRADDDYRQFSSLITVVDGMVTVVLRGELDLAVTPSLSRQLAQFLEQKPRRLVFDLERVGFLDCAAAQLIVGTGTFLPDGQQPVIRCPSPVVRRLLELTGLDTYCQLEG